MATQHPLSSPLLGRTNFSYYTVPLAWVLCMAPHVYAFLLYDRLAMPSNKFDKVNPRTFPEQIERNQGLSPEVKGRLLRAEAAQANSFENLGWFAAGVVAANTAGVDTWWVNALSVFYLFNRAAFNVMYIHGVKGFVRGGPFYASIGSTIALFIQAGNALRRVKA